MDSQQALQNFWSSFGWKAYEESSVPDDALESQDGIITYTAGIDEFNRSLSLAASLWRRSTSWEAITQKCEEINEAIGLGGKVVWYDDGGLWIKRGTPFAQRIADEDPAIRRIYMNVEVEYFTAK